MKNKKHISGPLICAAKPSSVVGWPIVSAGRGRAVANLHYFPSGFPKSDELNAEAHETGKLIAAAYTAFDAAADRLDMGALALAEKMKAGQLADIVGALEKCLLLLALHPEEAESAAIAEAEALLCRIKGMSTEPSINNGETP